MSMQDLDVQIAEVSRAARDIVVLELRPCDGGSLPAFTAGAHIDVHLAAGVTRSYSLLNAQEEVHRYVIAVHRSPTSRGGSAYVHDHLQTGMRLRISAPRNHFALDESAAHSEFIAGGIGITPIFSMIQRLQALGRGWRLHYCARTADHAALRKELAAFGDHVLFNFDQEPGGRMLDLRTVVAGAPAGAHFYCCGPLPMLAAFESAVAHLPEPQVHVEYFSAKAPVAPAPGEARSYGVTLARSGVHFIVEPGQTILDKLIERDFDIAYSCREGVCGSCETPVLEGQPEHHDLVLSQAEKAANKTLMICCSGCRGDSLVLDL